MIIKKLRHKNRLVRKAAAFALPDDVVLRNLEDRQLYRNALQESLSNVVRDLRNDQPYVFESSYINPNRNINWKTEEIRERLDKLDEGDWESKMKIMDSAKVVANKEPFTGLETNEDLGERVPLSFKEWSKDNKGKTFSDYKSEVLGK